MLGLSELIIIPAKANTELVMFKPRLLRTKPFVVLLPATIENDPEIINPRILGSPFKNFSVILFHECESTYKGCPFCCAP